MAKQKISPNITKDLKEIGLSIHLDSNNIKFYSYEKLTLSRLYPIMQSMNFDVVEQKSVKIDDIYISEFYLQNIDLDRLALHFENIKKVLYTTLSFNLPNGCKLLQLAYAIDATTRNILLLRALIEYQDQITTDNQFADIVQLLVKHTNFTVAILDYFDIKFNPLIKTKNRDKELKIKDQAIQDNLKDIADINEDKIAKMFFIVVRNIVRTNYYLDKNTISLKIETKNFKHLLEGIQPNIEAFVFSKIISGVHLRTGKVCRGGLRWSERSIDYRDEVKSLMIAQESKNSVIVPNGSKGGFVIKQESITKEQFEQYYTFYIDAILDLVDTEDKDGNTIKDQNIIAYDDDDTYFVVAADKGTASMSDVANSIATSKNFWLKDSFASGGSTGYHHKKLGITAKGAIRSTQRFFIEKGLDFYKEPISVVGIGSMIGDVFGNGLIESKYFKLIAAIDNKHIFIDPNPNLDEAYEERKRLFTAKDGSWDQYSKLSKGGAVYDRSQKEIKLTQEIKELIGYKKDIISSDKLAQKLLTLKIDMLFSGGIGSYVKASDETNLEVGDKENEFVRVDAKDIKAYTICEGANLSVTPRARIEYALNGGKINLDSIDNSAGVDTSDHEVNYTILLNRLQDGGIIDNKDELLEEQTHFVVESVLRTNYRQALSISLDELRSSINIKPFHKTIQILDEQLEFFKPKLLHVSKLETYDDKVLRPILSVLTLYSKIFIQKLLLESNMLDDSEFDYYLNKYFSATLVYQYEHSIALHPLRKEIIAMIISNKIINATGSTFISNFDQLGKDKFLLKIKSYLIINRFFTATNMRIELFKKDYEISKDTQYDLFIELEKHILKAVDSLVESDNKNITFENILSNKNSLDKILKDIIKKEDSIQDNNIDPNYIDFKHEKTHKQEFDAIENKILNTLEKHENLGIYFKMLKYLQLATEALKIETQQVYDFDTVARSFFTIVNKLNIINLIDMIDKKKTSIQGDDILKEQLQKILKSLLSAITISLLNFKRHDESIDDAIENYFKEIDLDMIYFNDMNLQNQTLKDMAISVNYLVVKIL